MNDILTVEILQNLLPDITVDDEYVAQANDELARRVSVGAARKLSLENLTQLNELTESGDTAGAQKLIDENVSEDDMLEIFSNETDILLKDLVDTAGDIAKAKEVDMARG